MMEQVRGQDHGAPGISYKAIGLILVIGIVLCTGLFVASQDVETVGVLSSSTIAAVQQAWSHHRVQRTTTTSPTSVETNTRTNVAPAPVTTSVSTPTTTTTITVAVVPSSATSSLASTTTAPAPAIVMAPNNSSYGVSLGVTLLGKSSSQLNAEMNDLASLGIGWIRMDFDWSILQPAGPTTYQNWALYDAVVTSAQAHNIKVLGILDGAPSWEWYANCSNAWSCPPANDSQFATYATAVVARYAPQGVHDWEVWNEPNNKGFWAPSADAIAYVQLLKAVYPAIKQADPSAVVISGGLAPEATSNGNIAPVDFLSLLYSLGGRNYFDAVGFHPYSYPAMPGYSATWNAWQQMFATNPSIRSVMTANGDSGKQIWMTEYGAPTGGPGSVMDVTTTSFAGSPDHVTEALQSQMIEQAIQLKATYAWSGPLFIYSYQDLGTSQTTVENFFGLLHNDGSQKSAYATLKRLIAQ